MKISDNEDLGFKNMKLAHTMIRIQNLEASLKFYCDFLGLQEVRRKNLGNEATLVFLSDDAGNYHIELTLNRDGRDYTVGDQFGHLAFHVDDLDGEPLWRSMVRMEGQRNMGSLEFQGHSREERAKPDHVSVLAHQPQVCPACG